MPKSLRLFCIFLLLSRAPVRAHAADAPAATPKDSTQSAVGTDDDDEDDDDDDAAMPGDASASHAPADVKAAAANLAEEDDDDDDDDDGEPDPKVLKANVAFTSDYLARGITFSNHTPALQGGLDWEHPKGPILGTWSSSANLPDTNASLELDAYGGYFFDFGRDQEFEEVFTLHYDTFFVGKQFASWAFAEQTSWRAFSLSASYTPSYRENGFLLTTTAGWHDEVKWEILLGAYVDYTAYANQSLTTTATESTVNAEGEEQATQVRVSESTPNYADLRLSVGHEFFGAIWQVEGVLLKKQDIEGILASPRAAFMVSKEF